MLPQLIEVNPLYWTSSIKLYVIECKYGLEISPICGKIKK